MSRSTAAVTADRASPVVLGIETSCDDTACAIVDGEGTVLASAVSSQIEAHRPFGGVVPEIASREHLRNWPEVSAEALESAGLELAQIDVVAATRGPGLIGALLVGLSLGKSIAWALQRPFHGVHHLEGHLYSPFLAPPGEPTEQAPEEFIGLVVSGGHTALYEVSDGRVETLGQTRDDALGEAFDKVGKRLGIAYPQGPRVDELAESGEAERVPLPLSRCGDTLDFSYSGLKTQTLVEIERLEREGLSSDLGGDDPAAMEPRTLDLVAGFRAAAVAQIVDRLERLRRQRPIDLLAVSGGAAANRLLRRELADWAAEREIDLRLVPLRYSGDNAAMIAHAALLRHRAGRRDDPLTAVAASRIPF